MRPPQAVYTIASSRPVSCPLRPFTFFFFTLFLVSSTLPSSRLLEEEKEAEPKQTRAGGAAPRYSHYIATKRKERETPSISRRKTHLSVSVSPLTPPPSGKLGFRAELGVTGRWCSCGRGERTPPSRRNRPAASVGARGRFCARPVPRTGRQLRAGLLRVTPERRVAFPHWLGEPLCVPPRPCVLPSPALAHRPGGFFPLRPPFSYAPSLRSPPPALRLRLRLRPSSLTPLRLSPGSPPSLDVSSESSLTPFPLHLTWGLRVRAAPERSSAGRRPPSLPIPPRAPRPAPRTAARPAWEPPCGAGARLPRPNGLRGRCPAPPALGASGCGQLLQPKGGFLLENRVHGTRAAHFAKNARTRRDLDALALREAKPKKREKNCGCSVACALPAPLCLPPSF